MSQEKTELFKDLAVDFVRKIHNYEMDEKRTISIDLADTDMEVVIWVRPKSRAGKNSAFGYFNKKKKK